MTKRKQTNSPKKLDAMKRAELSELVDELEMIQSELEHKRALLRLKLATYTKELGASLKYHAICLLCGAYHLNNQSCECQKPKQ